MENASMKSLVTQVRGVSYESNDLRDNLDESSVTLLRANNIADGRINFDDVVFVDRKKVSRDQLLRKGDILVCTSSGSKKLVGKAAAVDFDMDATFGAFCKVIRPCNIEDADYISKFFQSPKYKHKISSVAMGANINNIRNEHIDTLIIGWPSRDERKKIVAILSEVDSIIHKRKKEIQTFDELIKARFVEMFGDPEFNTKGWSILPLGKLCDVKSSKRIYQNELQNKDGVSFWRVSDLVNKMENGIADSGLFISEKKYKELRNVGLVPVSGDILVTSRGTLGRCYIIKDEDQFYFQDGMISWLSNYDDSITPLYLQYLFSMPGFKKQIDSMQAGSTVAYLSIVMLRKLQIMIPDIDLQNTFDKFVVQVNKSKAAVQKALYEAQLLFDSQMQQYFG